MISFKILDNRKYHMSVILPLVDVFMTRSTFCAIVEKLNIKVDSDGKVTTRSNPRLWANFFASPI